MLEGSGETEAKGNNSWLADWKVDYFIVRIRKSRKRAGDIGLSRGNGNYSGRKRKYGLYKLRMFIHSLLKPNSKGSVPIRDGSSQASPKIPGEWKSTQTIAQTKKIHQQGERDHEKAIYFVRFLFWSLSVCLVLGTFVFLKHVYLLLFLSSVVYACIRFSKL